MKKPYWMRRHFACPDCGFIVDENSRVVLGHDKLFDCPRCKAHYEAEEFMQLNQDKWSKEADVSSEQQP